MEESQPGDARGAEFRVELVDRAPTFVELTLSSEADDGTEVVTDQLEVPLDGLPAGDYPALWEAMTTVADRLLAELGWVHESGWMRHAAEAVRDDGRTCGEAWLACAVRRGRAPAQPA